MVLRRVFHWLAVAVMSCQLEVHILHNDIILGQHPVYSTLQQDSLSTVVGRPYAKAGNEMEMHYTALYAPRELCFRR